MVMRSAVSRPMAPSGGVNSDYNIGGNDEAGVFHSSLEPTDQHTLAYGSEITSLRRGTPIRAEDSSAIKDRVRVWGKRFHVYSG